jgi:hypothetical protein
MYTGDVYWEIWDIESGNMVGHRDTEAEALALVRDLIGRGWPIAALSLMPEDESLEVEMLPPAISGDELARRAHSDDGGPARRTA